MEETYEPVIDYLRLPKSTVWDIIGPVVVILLFIIILYFAWRAQKWQNRAAALVKSKSPKRSRRYHKRVPLSIPVRLSTMDYKRHFAAEIVDISLGGIRLLTTLEGIAATMKYTITTKTPPWVMLEPANLMVLRMAPGPSDDTAILRARWIGLKKEHRLMLRREIKKRMKQTASPD